MDFHLCTLRELRDHAKKFWGGACVVVVRCSEVHWSQGPVRISRKLREREKKNWGEGKVFLGTGCIFERGVGIWEAPAQLPMHATPRWRWQNTRHLTGGTLDISAKSKNDCEGKRVGKCKC